MSLGRISGPLLQENLVRNGVDLNFRNQSADTPLLFFDVANNRLGVNKDAPGTDLDLIDSTLRTTGLLAPTTNQSIANYTLSGSNLNVSTGDINFNAAEAIVASTIETDNIRITDNTISTFNSNASFDLTPNGTGIVDVLSDMKVFGNLDTPSTITMGGSITIGDNSSDTIDFNTDMTSDLTPDVTDTSNLGSANNKWDNIYSFRLNGASLEIPNIRVDTNTISTLTSNSNLDLIGNASGNVKLEDLEFATNVISTSTGNDLTLTVPPMQWAATLTKTLYPVNTAAYVRLGMTLAASGNYTIVWDGQIATWVIYNIITGAIVTNINQRGYSVSMDSNYLIIGDQTYDDGVNNDSGRAYIYKTTTGDWSDITLLHTLDNPNAYDTSVYDNFGYSVDIDGNSAIVSALYEDDAGGSASGKAYIFNVTTGALLHTLDNPTAYGTSYNDRFGNSVAISGNSAIVGASYEYDSPTLFRSGKAYIFNVTSGALLHTLDNPNAYGTSAGDYFGQRVAISGNSAIVSSWQEDDAGGFTSGKAYIFNVTSGALVHTLDNPNAYGTSYNDQFGGSVAISGNYAIVGAGLEDDAGGTNSGKAYIFDVTTGGLLTTINNPNDPEGNPGGTSASDFFSGYQTNGVAISDNYIIASSPYEDRRNVDGSISQDAAGVVYVFELSNSHNTIISTTSALKLPSGTTVQRPNVNLGVRFNTTTSRFEGYYNGNTILGGVYSSNELTNIVAHPTNDTVPLTVNNTVIGTVTATGITVHGLQVDNINVDGSIISTATDTDLILAPAGNVSNKSVKIDNLFIGETVGTQQIKSDNNIIEFAVTGQGSTKIPSSYAVTIPTGTTANRPASPQLGDTRWNGVLEQMETYNGSSYISSAGTGGVISRADYDDLLLQYTILLG